MSQLPRGLSYRSVVTVLRKVGFHVRRQKVSHIIMIRGEPHAQVVVPAHRAIDTGTLHDIVQAAGLTVDAFLDLL